MNLSFTSRPMLFQANGYTVCRQCAVRANFRPSCCQWCLLRDGAPPGPLRSERGAPPPRGTLRSSRPIIPPLGYATPKKSRTGGVTRLRTVYFEFAPMRRSRPTGRIDPTTRLRWASRHIRRRSRSRWWRLSSPDHQRPHPVPLPRTQCHAVIPARRAHGVARCCPAGQPSAVSNTRS